MTHAGIDFDTHAVHVALLPEDAPASYHAFPLEGPDAIERTRAVRDAMPGRSWWLDAGVIAVGIEMPFGPNRGTLWPVFGAIISNLPRGPLIQPLTASGWRKTVGLPGNASKQDVAVFATWEGGLGAKAVFWPQDAIDAWAIALAVSRLTERVDAA